MPHYYILKVRQRGAEVYRYIRPTREFSATRKCGFGRKSGIVSVAAITSGASKNLQTSLFIENGEIWRWILRPGG
jgi:hypothetical protein